MSNSSFISLFADDTSLYIIVDNPFQAAEQLNSDLDKIHRWAAKWLVTYLIREIQRIFFFSRTHNRPLHPLILMDQTPITEVESHKLLLFDSRCSAHGFLLCVCSTGRRILTKL